MFKRFQHRSLELERLDTGDYTTEEYSRWQREMWFIHRIFGEIRALKTTLLNEINHNRKESVSVLDVGAGSGQLLRELQKWTVGSKIFLAGAEIDHHSARSIRRQNIHAVQCDALNLPFSDNSFDYVFCSLFLHHLKDEDAVYLLREMARVARLRIFVIDLNRHPTAYYVYKMIGHLFLQRFTLDDGALSILRSYNPDELRVLAEKARLSDIKIQHSRINRLILSGRK